MKSRLLFSLVVHSLVLGTIVAAACTPTQRAVGRTVVKAAEVACVEIDDGEKSTVCATVEELAPFVKAILGARKAKAAALSSAAKDAGKD